MKRPEQLAVEGAKLIFRNFAGAETMYNRKGSRNFSVLFEEGDLASRLIADGWNLKPLPLREDDSIQMYHLPVAVSYEHVPPRVTLVTQTKQTIMDEDTVGSLDYADLINVDLTITPYVWEVQGKTGVKAYLKSGFFVIQEDVFADKYREFDFEDF